MGWLRGLGRLAGIGLWIVVLAPALALAPAAFLDRGPGGSARPTVFPLALVTLDPVVWDCVWNSLAVAAVVASGSLVAGVGLARALVRWRFRGRMPLAALALATLVIPPLFEAMGLRRLFQLWRGADAPAAWEHGWGWVGWAWVGLAGGVPLVALASATALARVEPAWEDAARLAGASRLRTWWRLSWPIVRPSAARGGGGVHADARRAGRAADPWPAADPGLPDRRGRARPRPGPARRRAGAGGCGPRDGRSGPPALVGRTPSPRPLRPPGRPDRGRPLAPRPGPEPDAGLLGAAGLAAGAGRDVLGAGPGPDGPSGHGATFGRGLPPPALRAPGGAADRQLGGAGFGGGRDRPGPGPGAGRGASARGPGDGRLARGDAPPGAGRRGAGAVRGSSRWGPTCSARPGAGRRWPEGSG